MSDNLNQLGWKPLFAQAWLNLDEEQYFEPMRVVEVQRSHLTVAQEIGKSLEVAIGGKWFLNPPDERPTIGDWVLVDPSQPSLHSLLPRFSEIKRLSPGGDVQLIAANIDTAFLVTSCNADFNLARLERYLVVVKQANIQPVVVLTKADLVSESDSFVEEVRSLGRDIMVECVNALDLNTLQGIVQWCGPGQSVAMLGSSGVGKSTLVNTLAGEEIQLTGGIRDDDAKGRHTTTNRSLHLLSSGAVVVDSPGMRELQLTDVEDGVQALFADVLELAQRCRFNNCQHASEPSCAVQLAISSGQLDERRLQNYFKLLREERHNTESVAQRHARSRQFNKMVKSSVKRKQKRRDSK